MANKPPTPTPPAGGSQPPADGSTAAPAAAAEFDWSTLAAPAEAPSKTVAESRKINVLTEIPDVIRARAEASLALNTKAVAAKVTSEAARPRVDYRWDWQPVPTVKIGDEFKAKLERYAKYRPTNVTIPYRQDGTPDGQVTVRTGKVIHTRKTDGGDIIPCDETTTGAFLAIRYSVRPFEGRRDSARVPGTA